MLAGGGTIWFLEMLLVLRSQLRASVGRAGYLGSPSSPACTPQSHHPQGFLPHAYQYGVPMKDTRRWTVLEFLAETPKSAAEKAAVREGPWGKASPGLRSRPPGTPIPLGLTQFDVPVEGEQDVAGLHVPVDDLAAVQVLQGQQQLLASRSDLLLRQPFLQLCRWRKRTSPLTMPPAQHPPQRQGRSTLTHPPSWRCCTSPGLPSTL